MITFMSSICVVVLLIGFLFSKNIISPVPGCTSGLPNEFAASSAPVTELVWPTMFSPPVKFLYPVLSF